MRRIVLVLSLLMLLPAGGRQALAQIEVPGGVQSSNVHYVGTIPLDSPGVGGKVLRVGDQTRFYVTGAKGLMIYDVTNPAIPLLIGLFPFPHFQNEDVEVSDDGTRVVIAADTVSPGIWVIDTTIPQAPFLRAFQTSSNHTATCADPACDWIYGSSGRIYDARTTPLVVNTGVRWRNDGSNRGGHALNRDAAGIVISDSNPRYVLDVTDPLLPQVLTSGIPDGVDGFLQHNNVRPRAEQWVARAPGDNDPALRAGELLIGNSESNGVDCGPNVGGLSTWSMKNFDRGEPMVQLHKYKPRSGDLFTSGDPPFNAALGCSGHWFTERDNVVTTAWYEHGIRFFRIDPTDGEITQIGYFNPVATEAGAAHWVDDEYVYTVDYARGIDILRFDRNAPPPSDAEIDRSWLGAQKARPAAGAERLSCRIAATG